jgi:TRAP-type C4-dicarboxylate transport system permease small subunit
MKPRLALALKLERLLDALLAVALAVMVTTISYQVFGRYALGRAPSWTEELTRFLLIWMTMLGSAAALRHGGHITVTFLVEMLNPYWQAVFLVIRDVFLVAVSGIFMYFGLKFAMLNGAQESAALEIPMMIPYAALPACGLLILAIVGLTRWARSPIEVAQGEFI